MGKCKINIASIENCAGQGNASGLVKQLMIAAVSHIESIPDDVKYLITGDIVMKADVRTDAEVTAGDPAEAVPGLFHKFDFKESGLNLTSEIDGDEEDGNRMYTAAGKLPRRSALASYILDGMGGGQEFVVGVTDRNRYTSLLGDLVEGAAISATETTDGNGYDVSIKWRSGRMLYEYDGAFPTA